MKKILILLCLLFISNIAFAEENATQITKNNQAYATLNIQKQPQNSKQKQDINNHFTFFTVNIQINGKINDTNSSNK